MTSAEHAAWLMRWGDDALILGQRLGEWCGHGPVLEEDIALTNLALDLIGQARWLLTRAGELEGQGRTEDDLAFFRTDREFHNHLLVEQLNGDFAHTLVRHLFYAEFAARKAEAVAAGTWDGTEESRSRTLAALERLAPWCGELFEDDALDASAAEAGLCPLPSSWYADWHHAVASCLAEAELPVPDLGLRQRGGKQGHHTEHLSYLLAEMQVLQRTYPGATW